MKKLFILFAAAMIAVSAMAQDIIYRSDNDSINANVLTVNNEEVSYKLFGYEDGPLFTMKTNSIAAIHYANGMLQKFANSPSPQARDNSSAKAQTNHTGKKNGAVFIGATGEIGYTTAFTFAIEPVIGYEFSDRVAVGTGIGMIASIYANNSYSLKSPRRAKSYSNNSIVMGIVEPFVRICAWHNDIVFVDFKATTGIGFTSELELCQIGIRPSLRVRLTDHCEMSADIGLFGAQYTYNAGWTPAIGISATSAGLWFTYRF
ncbi:MAG: hypothetical protein IJT12_09275 [Paludibacteraceae bacterium]|nr:hypothetical protein [Paludibacteraceae bacterium]